jgi:RNA polymerase sigma factor (sigma-70 family)
MSAESVTNWLAELRDGDPEAAQAVWIRYYERLLSYARRKLGNMPRRVADEEDVVLSAFNSFCQGAAAGRFPQLADRDDLWKVLITITARKAVAHIRHVSAEKRGAAQVRGESVFLQNAASESAPGIQVVAGQHPTPEFAAMLTEQFECLFACLEDETLQRIALLKLEGYSNTQIAEKLGCVRETVQRKLSRIRGKWLRVCES